MFRLQGFKQMIKKPSHDSGTIIDHFYVSQTVNTIQTDVTDCYYSDHDCILCMITVLIDIYPIFVKQWYIYIMNIILCMLMFVKYSKKCRSMQNISNKCQFGIRSDPEGGVHLTNMSL